MPSLVIIGQQIKEKRKGTGGGTMCPIPSLAQLIYKQALFLCRGRGICRVMETRPYCDAIITAGRN